MSTKNLIADACRETVVLLRSKLSEAAMWNTGLRYALEDIETRLVVWIGNVGALAPETANLDHRLRDDSEMAGMLHSMLDRVKTDLTRLKNIDIQLPTLVEETECEAIDEEDKGALARDEDLYQIHGTEDTRKYDKFDTHDSRSTWTEEPSVLREEDRRKDVDSTPPTTASGHSSDTSSLRSSPSSDNRSESEENDDSIKNPQWKERLSSMNGVVDRLFRFAAVLRNPSGSSSEETRVRAFMAKRPSDRAAAIEDEDFRVHIQWYLTLDRFKDLSPVLRDRFCETMIFRRAMILYRRKHQSKLAQIDLGQQEPAVPHPTSQFSCDEASMILITLEPREHGTWSLSPSIDTVILSSLTSDAQMTSPSKLRPNNANTSRIAAASERPAFKPILSLTVASTANRQNLARYQKSVVTSDIALTQAGLERRAQLDIPKSGILANQSTACQFCFQFIPEEETKGPKWSRHLLRDIKPYICLFPKCGQSHQLFRTPEEWLSHTIQTHNTIWCCQSEDHESCIYDSREGIIEHFHLEHPDEFSEDETSQLVDLSAKPSPDLLGKLDSAWGRNDSSPGGRKCPLCVAFPPELPTGMTQLEDAGSDQEEDANLVLYEHLLQHFEELALKCLPYAGTSEDALSGSGSALLRTRQSGYLTPRRPGSTSNRQTQLDQNLGYPTSQSEIRRNSMEGFEATTSTEDLVAHLGHFPELELDGSDLTNYEERVEFIYQKFHQPRLPKPEDDTILRRLANHASSRCPESDSGRTSGGIMKEPELSTPSGRHIVDKHMDMDWAHESPEKKPVGNTDESSGFRLERVFWVYNAVSWLTKAGNASTTSSRLDRGFKIGSNPEALLEFCREVFREASCLHSLLCDLFRELPFASTARRHRIIAYEYEVENDEWYRDKDINEAFDELFDGMGEAFLLVMSELFDLFSDLMADDTSRNDSGIISLKSLKRPWQGSKLTPSFFDTTKGNKVSETIKNFRITEPSVPLHELLKGKKYFRRGKYRNQWVGQLKKWRRRAEYVVENVLLPVATKKKEAEEKAEIQAWLESQKTKQLPDDSEALLLMKFRNLSLRLFSALSLVWQVQECNCSRKHEGMFPLPVHDHFRLPQQAGELRPRTTSNSQRGSNSGSIISKTILDREDIDTHSFQFLVSHDSGWCEATLIMSEPVSKFTSCENLEPDQSTFGLDYNLKLSELKSIMICEAVQTVRNQSQASHFTLHVLWDHGTFKVVHKPEIYPNRLNYYQPTEYLTFGETLMKTKRPSLSTQSALAFILALSHFLLDGLSPWSGSSTWDKDHIVFFLTSHGQPNFERPYLRTYFDQPVPIPQAEPPRYVFQPNPGTLKLGMLILELFQWKPMEQFDGMADDGNVHHVLLQRLSHLGLRQYERNPRITDQIILESIAACVVFTWGNDSPQLHPEVRAAFEDADFWIGFYGKVVSPLQDLIRTMAC